MAKLVLCHVAKLSKIKQMWHLQMICSKFAIEVNPFFRPVLPRAKILLVSLIFFSRGYIIFWVLRFDWINVIFAACFILRGHDTDIDFLRLLFQIGKICALTQENFLWPLLKRKSLSLRLNKSWRLFNLLQSVSWIWIAKGDILLSVNVMVSFNVLSRPSSFSVFCRMLNFHW